MGRLHNMPKAPVRSSKAMTGPIPKLLAEPVCGIGEDMGYVPGVLDTDHQLSPAIVGHAPVWRGVRSGNAKWPAKL